MVSLTKIEKAKTKVVFATLITALCFQNVAEEMGADQTSLLAVKSMEKLIDELILSVEEGERRNKLIDYVQRARIKFNKKVSHMDKGSAFIASLNVFTGETFKSKIGTRFDYLRQTLRTNMPYLVESLPHRPDYVQTFQTEFKKAVLAI